MNLFYHPDIEPDDTEIEFGKDESRHFSKVLRYGMGDQLHITNGQGWIFKAELTQLSNSRCTAKVISTEQQKGLPYRLHLAVAPTKRMDRYEWFLEKATEIGVHTITPVFCDHSERKVVKPERLERIIESAMKQSLSAFKPTLKPGLTFKAFIDQSENNHGIKSLAHCAEGSKKLLKDQLGSSDDITILIGPEGDFSTAEIQMAEGKGWSSISLGSARLRTETAAIVACHTVSLHYL